MAEVLDYSSGHPAPAAVLAGRYAGVVRYAGTPGRGKNLTRAEAQAMLGAAVPVGLVYEGGAGWMLSGASAGVAAAKAVLADADRCGVGVRCVYFAADFDVTSAAQMAVVEQCLDGAASVLGRARVGVYGEADVIDACLGQGHAVWGWQTRAWSAGRVSARAHLLQQVGYVQVGGIQCDRSTVLRRDWGQWPAPAAVEEEEPLSDTQYETLTRAMAEVRKALADLQTTANQAYKLTSVGDAPDTQKDAAGKPIDRGGHPYNLEAIRADLAKHGQQLAAISAAVAGLDPAPLRELGQQLAELRAAIDSLAPLVAEAVGAKVAEAVGGGIHVDITVQGQPVDADPTGHSAAAPAGR